MSDPPMSDQTVQLDQAADRLERAVAALESRLRALKASSARGESDMFDQDRARLAEDLDRARAREKALEEAAAEASKALGHAMTEVRAVMAGEA